MTYNTIVSQRFTEGGEIERDRIVDEDLVSEDCFCPICQYLLWKPQSCSTCHHNFCEKCLHTWLENPTSQNKCPFRCQPFQSCPCSPDIQSALSQLNVRCRNAPFGCSQILLYDQLEHHENVQCQYLSKRCSECEQLVLLSKYDEHRQSEELCRPGPIKCTTCKNHYEKSVMRDHFHECCTKKADQIMARTFQNPQDQIGNNNQTAEPNIIVYIFQYIVIILALFQQQMKLSRIPTSLKGVYAVKRAREQKCGYLRHMTVMLKFFLLNWTKVPFFILNMTLGVLLVKGTFGLGFYILFCEWICRSNARRYLSLILIVCLSTYGTRFVCRSFSDQTIILFVELSKFLFVCAIDRAPLEIYEFSPLFKMNKLCIALYCLILLAMKIVLLLIRFYYWLIPTPVTVVLFTCVSAYLALKVNQFCPGRTATAPRN